MPSSSPKNAKQNSELQVLKKVLLTSVAGNAEHDKSNDNEEEEEEEEEEDEREQNSHKSSASRTQGLALSQEQLWLQSWSVAPSNDSKGNTPHCWRAKTVAAAAAAAAAVAAVAVAVARPVLWKGRSLAVL